MFKEVAVLVGLMVTTVSGIAQEGEGHYFEIYGSLSTPFSGPLAEFLEVIVTFDGKQHIVIFDADPQYLFPLEKINLTNSGVVQIDRVRFKDPGVDVIHEISFDDNPACQINIKTKNPSQESTISSLYVSTYKCGDLSIRPYREND